MQVRTEEDRQFILQYHSDHLVSMLHTIINTIDNIDKSIPHYDYIVDLAGRAYSKLQNLKQKPTSE